MSLLIVFYSLCWTHMTYRVGHGGNTSDGPQEYLCDASCRTLDLISWATVILGTIIIPFIIF